MASLNEKTSASASPIPPKPLSASLKGAGGPKQPQPPLTNINSRHLFRDNFSVGTWLLLGASFQAILLLLPIRPSYAISPGLLMLGYRFVYGLGQIFGVVAYDGMRDVVPGKTAASYPETYDVNGQRVASDRGICVIMLFSRCNHPLGLFAPHFKDLGENMAGLVAALDAQAPNNGFLGSTSWMNTSDRDTQSEIMTLCYFDTHAALQAFAHGPEHRKIWDWWLDLSRKKQVPHISIAHEMYCVGGKAGETQSGWEGIYVNQAPSLFAATQHWVRDENGEGSWKSGLVEGKGRYRTALGRMGRSGGEDNVKYGEEPYGLV